MNNQKSEQALLHPRVTTLLVLIFAVMLFRFLPHPPNVSPVTAISLFAGAFFYDRKLAFIVPFAALLMSDLVIGVHDTMVYVYAAFGLSVLMGRWLQTRRSIGMITATTLASSLLFFGLTNLGVWLTGIHAYSMDAQGLMQAYVAGIPFLQNSVLGNLFFVVVLFGGFAALQKLRPKLANA